MYNSALLLQIHTSNMYKYQYIKRDINMLRAHTKIPSLSTKDQNGNTPTDRPYYLHQKPSKLKNASAAPDHHHQNPEAQHLRSETKERTQPCKNNTTWVSTKLEYVLYY
ncbi:hypothetical protein AQUCO_08700011v1 [Aquilegia coerulea]|uniref:Uncharacterized protein n=1 Tax=Aquilegia coerulea TaxID=218851 RepID=A0A2G5C6D1_AQUCA|nr:hypothetical protein AQUCO_08700011v1 [Aquilegia coerulea]